MNVTWKQIVEIATGLGLTAEFVAQIARRLGCIIADCPADIPPADIPDTGKRIRAARAKAVEASRYKGRGT